MTENNKPIQSTISLTHVLREALATRARCIFFVGTRSYAGIFVDLEESGNGRNVTTKSVNLLVDEIEAGIETLDSERCVLKFHTATGFYELDATGTFSDSAVPLIVFRDLSAVNSTENRRGSRPILGGNPKSFVVVSSDAKKMIGSFEVKDVSVDAIGGVLILPSPLTGVNITISGHISSGASSLRLKNASLFRSDLQNEKKGKTYSYTVAVGTQNFSTTNTETERRKFVRHSNSSIDVIEVFSSLFSGVKILLRLTDISTAGLAAMVVDEKDEVLLPIGCQILFNGICGEIVYNFNSVVRVKWTFDSDFAHKVWQEEIAKIVGLNVELRSYESQSTLTLLARSGIKSSKYITSYQTAKDMLPAFGEIEKSGDPIVYRALQRDSKGSLDAHIGSFKIADNLWFNGDLFSSQSREGNSTKEFVKEYFVRFIEFARSSRPYPKVLSAWIKGHPYWQKLEKALTEGEGKVLLYASASVKTLLPDVNTELRPISDTLEKSIVSPLNIPLITEVLEKARVVGLDKFLTSLDFEPDRFGSPGLRLCLERGKYKFLREYFYFKMGVEIFIAVVSHMPEGLSPQRHQNAVWLFSLSERPSNEALKEVINAVTITATEIGTFPSVIRIVGKDLSELPERDGFLVLADPLMWELAG